MARYDEIESRWLLPVFMRADTLDTAMSDIVDEFGADMSGSTRDCSVWNAIDDMDEAAIDALADELNIIWYDKLATLESKRSIVKNCKHLQAKLGTKWGMEQILEYYFPGNTRVTEWFQYTTEGGEPGHFRIETEIFDEIDAELERFLGILSLVKRKSAIFDGLVAINASESIVSTGAIVHDYRVVTIDAIRRS